MRFIAEFVMRGRLQAIGVCLFGVLVPMMYWLTNAAVSFVILRKGVREGLFTLLWSCLPIVVLMFVYEESTPMVILMGILLGSALLAGVLRQTQSWEATLAVAVLIAGLGTFAFEFGASTLMSEIVDQYLRFLNDFRQQLSGDTIGSGNSALAVLPTSAEAHELLFGSIALCFAYSMVLFLMLGRWWQSELYNQGGFGLEFQNLRLSHGFSVVLIMGLVLTFGLDNLVRWIYLLTMPLFLAAIGFVHWIVKKKKLSSRWLTIFYLMMIFMFQLLAPVLITVALIDSWFDLRKRIKIDREVE